MGALSRVPWVPSILRLFFGCSPSAVIWFVIAIIVDAIDGMLRRWSSPHGSEKSAVRKFPFITNLYAAPTIPRPVLVLGV